MYIYIYVYVYLNAFFLPKYLEYRQSVYQFNQSIQNVLVYLSIKGGFILFTITDTQNQN